MRYRITKLTLVFLLLINVSQAATIRGWPQYLAMGTVTNDMIDAGLAANPVDAIFKYAGNDGSGDQGKIILNDPAVIETIQEARYVEANKQNGLPKTVMPVLVVYTIDASGGVYSAVPDVSNDVYLSDHFINLINMCQVMEKYKDATHPNPATIILNPDFFGSMQQAGTWGPLQPSTSVNVNNDLAKALSYLNLPNSNVTFDDTLAGYIQAVNWIIHTYGPDIPFGWQENLWAVGSANWIHHNYSNDQLQENITTPVVNYINSLGAYQGNYKPDFIVFDRFERDDFFILKTQWLYNRRDWGNYLAFVKNISDALAMPAIIWQIPGGHILTNTEQNPTLTLNQVATAPDYFFGDSNVVSNFPNNITPQVLNFTLDPSSYDTNSTTAGDYLQQDSDHNWQQPQLQNAVADNIVAILWGGGSTTAVVSIVTNGDDGGWLANKIKSYYTNPIMLTPSLHKSAGR